MPHSSTDYEHFPPTEVTCRNELATFAKKPNLDDADPTWIAEWAEATRDEVRRLYGVVKTEGYSKVVVPASVEERRQLFWIACAVSAKDSTSGAWYNKLKTPGIYPRNKIGVFTHMERNVEKRNEFLDACEDVYQWLKLGDGAGMPLTVIGKDEPVKLKKLLEGRHRTIQFPDWTVLTVEMAHSLFTNGEDEYKTLDDVMATVTDPTGVKFHHALGHDTLLTVKLLAHSKKKDEKYVFYDVKAWDRTLPWPVIIALYEETIGNRKVARALAEGMCGQGVYWLEGVGYTLPSGVAAWCSGALKTLSGNSTIHGAFLTMLGLSGVVMGDDGLVLSSTPESTLEAIKEGFTKAGMQVKPGSEGYSDKAEFCSISIEGHELSVDTKRVGSKMTCRLGRSGDALVAATMDQLLLHVKHVNAMSIDEARTAFNDVDMLVLE